MTSNLKINTNFIPVELTTAKGYNDFVKSPKCEKRYSTIFPDNESLGYVLVDDEVVAVVSGEAKADLFDYAKAGYYLEDHKDHSTVDITTYPNMKSNSVIDPSQNNIFGTHTM